LVGRWFFSAVVAFFKWAPAFSLISPKKGADPDIVQDGGFFKNAELTSGLDHHVRAHGAFPLSSSRSLLLKLVTYDKNSDEGTTLYLKKLISSVSSIEGAHAFPHLRRIIYVFPPTSVTEVYVHINACTHSTLI